MKRVLAFALLGLLMVFGLPAYAEETAGSTAVVEEKGTDGRIIRKCPRCGEPLVFGHEHVEEEEGLPITVGADMSFYGKYVWRGLTLNPDAVFQPAVWANYKSLTVNIWGSMDLTDVIGWKGNLTEVDYTVDYSWAWDKTHFSVGGIHYEFPHTGFKSTTEVYGAVWYEMLLSPTLAVYYDFDEADGFYGTLTLAHSFEIPKIVEPVSASLGLSAQVGAASNNWNFFNYGVAKSAFDNLLLTASLPVSIGDNVTIKPSVSYSTVLYKALREAKSDDHNFIWGVTLSAKY